jgi:hypothetical protein
MKDNKIKGPGMRNLALIVLMFFASEAMAVCTAPISRTNFSPLTVLTSTKLNADLNALYTQVNELPGDCITDSTVTSAKILDGTIVNADISDGAAIARSKLGSVNYVLSNSSGSFSTSSASAVDVTNLSVTIEGTGKPIEISLIGTEGQSCYIGHLSTVATAELGTLDIVKNGSSLVKTYVNINAPASGNYDIQVPGSSVRHVDFSTFGSATYKLQASTATSSTLAVSHCKLLAREL